MPPRTSGFAFDPSKPVRDYTPIERDLLLYGTDSPQFHRHFPGIKPPTTVGKGRFEGVVSNLQRRYDEHSTNTAYREKLDHLFITQSCRDCGGTLLRPESRAVTVAGESIIKISNFSLNDLNTWLQFACKWDEEHGLGVLTHKGEVLQVGAASASFAGLRIVSIADPTAPVLLASVPTGVDAADAGVVRGSHTHTIVPDLEKGRLLVYAGVYYYPETQPHASIVEVPLDDPASARVIGTFQNGTTRPCHDITVFVPGKIAACAAYEAGIILFDVSDPVRPVVISSFVVPAIREHEESHHSIVFSADGTTLVVNSENGGPCMGGTDSTRVRGAVMEPHAWVSPCPGRSGQRSCEIA